MKTVRFGFFMYKGKFKSCYPSSLITEIPLSKFSKWFLVRAHLNLVFSPPLHNGVTFVVSVNCRLFLKNCTASPRNTIAMLLGGLPFVDS